MRLWGYYAFHTFINTIKKLFRSTIIAVILSILGFGIIFGFAGVLIGNALGSQTAQESVDESYEAEDADESDEEEDQPMSPEDIALVKMYVESIIMLVFIAVLLFGLYSGSKKGADIFQMADVNLLFTAPMKPQSVLMFRLSFQMAASIFASIYLIFQIPNFMSLGLSSAAIGAIFIGWILLMIFQRLMAVLSYTIFATHEHLKKYVLPLVLGIALVLLAATAAAFMANDFDLTATVKNTYASHWSRYIPIVGWYKAMIICAINQEMTAALTFFVLLLVSIGLLVFLIWHLKADFYEDALAHAGKTAEVLDAAKEGRLIQTKERSKRIRREGCFGGMGANVFLTKELYHRRRTAHLGFITSTMLVYLGASALTMMLMVKFSDNHSFFIPGLVLMLILFFRNLGNPIERETALNWLFLIPENPYLKVLFAMLAGTCNCAIDLLPALLVGVFTASEHPLMMLLWYVTLLIIDFMLSAVGVFLQAVFPADAMNLLKSLIQMFLRFFMLIVIILPVVIGYMIGGMVLALILTMLIGLVIGIPLFFIYPAMLHSGTKK